MQKRLAWPRATVTCKFMMHSILMEIKKYLDRSKNAINGNNCYDKKEKINPNTPRTPGLISSTMCHMVKKATVLFWPAQLVKKSHLFLDTLFRNLNPKYISKTIVQDKKCR